MRRAYLAAIAVLLTACIHGTQLKDFRPAHSPDGAQLRLRLVDRKAVSIGELFAVDSTGVLLFSGRLTHVRFERIRALDFVQLGAPYDMYTGRLGSADIEHLRLVSRFPQGLDGPTLARVLTALGQDSVQEVP